MTNDDTPPRNLLRGIFGTTEPHTATPQAPAHDEPQEVPRIVDRLAEGLSTRYDDGFPDRRWCIRCNESADIFEDHECKAVSLLEPLRRKP